MVADHGTGARVEQTCGASLSVFRGRPTKKAPTHLKPSLCDRIPDGFGGLDQAARHNQEGHGVGRHLLSILRHGPQIWWGAVALGGAVGVSGGVTVCLFSGCCALGTELVSASTGTPPRPHPALTHNLCVVCEDIIK